MKKLKCVVCDAAKAICLFQPHDKKSTRPVCMACRKDKRERYIVMPQGRHAGREQWRQNMSAHFRGTH